MITRKDRSNVAQDLQLINIKGGYTQMKKFLMVVLVALVVIGSVAGPAVAFGKEQPAPQSAVAQKAAFQDDMRKLWEDHIIWTRQVIVSLFAGLPDLNFALDRLLQNQADIGNAIKPFYGNAAGNQLTALLRQHILIAADLLIAAKTGNTTAFNDANTRWYANGNEIAVFLNGANPKYWPLDEAKSLMKVHMDTTLAEAVARLTGDWAGDVAAFDAVHRHILMMADFLSTGIIEQFPQKFAH